jgi:hypothetical protein
MSNAAFEEREYERALYHELRVANNRVWSPGQVLERRIGVDTTLFAVETFPFDLYGLSCPPGVRLSAFWRFLRRDLHVPPRRALPSFLLNVFIQSKRPRHLKTAARAIAQQGVRGAHWAFAVESEQQLVLEKLEAKFQGRAVVTYAAPVFHTEQALYRHTTAGTTVPNSTFPRPSRLTGHQNWHYKVPGATGVASSTPVAVDDESLDRRIGRLEGGGEAPPDTRGGTGNAPPPDGGWIGNLSYLAGGIGEVMADSDLPDTFRRSQYFLHIRDMTAYVAAMGEPPPWLAPYFEVVIFAGVYRLAWLCVA